MLKLSVNEIIKKINNEEPLECSSLDESFSLYITEYVPYLCTAIHNGSNLRRELRQECALTKAQRWYEEDPHTYDFIASLPMRICGNDSRYEYDLNRSLENCIYETAWGQRVWKKQLTSEAKQRSYHKHTEFYRVIDALIGKIQSKYKACVVYDIHSYNYKRITDKQPPMFNVGTKNVNKKFSPFIKDWIGRLASIESDFFDCQAKENHVFEGHGNFLKHISKKFKNTLVLATEVRKSYCDEESGDTFPEVIDDIKTGMRLAIIENAKLFIDKRANVSIKKKNHLLSSDIEPLAFRIDKDLFDIVKDFDLLGFVNPSNLESEKKKFFSKKFRVNPEFSYSPLEIDITALKKRLYTLPVDDLTDLTLRKLYKNVINAYADQIEMLVYRGDTKFKYMSLKYFGEPGEEDLRTARYFLRSPDASVIKAEMINTNESLDYLKAEVTKYGFRGKVIFARNIPSVAVFSPARNTLKIKKNVVISKPFLSALCHHEIGVHMLTTENARRQTLKVFEIGFAINTLTQEGLAIYSEYRAGLLTIDRLKELSLRVVAVNHMLRHGDFKDTFLHLVETYNVAHEKAFYLTTRIYRGGGFTKDYMYLKGFRLILNLARSGVSLSPLLIGKTSLEFIGDFNELIERKMIEAPAYITESFSNEDSEKDDVIEYLLKVF